MAALRQRDVIALIPADVLRRVRKGGCARGPDWYAGRVVAPTITSSLAITPASVRDEIKRACKLSL
jgi:hypothetical protein